jgi:two-component system CheB/CheR fusion protein
MRAETTPVHLRVLVVDDYRDTADTMAMLLRMWGHDVRVATDGPAALEVAGSYLPDVVLLDIGLPGMDGYEVARRLRQDVGLRRARLVSVSGYAEPKDHQQSRLAGCNDHLVKPVEPDMLQHLLTSWAGRPLQPAEDMRGQT